MPCSPRETAAVIFLQMNLIVATAGNARAESCADTLWLELRDQAFAGGIGLVYAYSMIGEEIRRSPHLGIASSARLKICTNLLVSSKPTLKRTRSASTPHDAHCRSQSNVVPCGPEDLPSPVRHNGPESHTESYRTIRLRAPEKRPPHTECSTHLRVKFVPRLGPLTVSRLSKNATASRLEKKVAESNPP